MKHFKVILILTLMLSGQVYAGRESGGADNPTWNLGAAWFYGSSRVVHACMVISPQFQKSQSEVQGEVERAFGTWAKYIEQKKISYPVSSPDYQLTTTLKILSKCDGTEDITFYFGASTPPIESSKKTYVNPTAFAERTIFDRKNKWAKGFIWVADPASVNAGLKNFPNWDIPNNLLAILLHEIGHILGCSHIDGTIMDSDINFYIAGSDNDAMRQARSQIDHYRELYRCDDCQHHYEAPLSADEGSQEVFQVLNEILGRSIKVNTNVKVQLDSIKGRQGPIVISIFDGQQKFTFPLWITSSVVSENDAIIFKSIDLFWKRNLAVTDYYYAVAADGTKISMALEYNMMSAVGRSPVRLVAFRDGKRIEIAEFTLPTIP